MFLMVLCLSLFAVDSPAIYPGGGLGRQTCMQHRQKQSKIEEESYILHVHVHTAVSAA